MGSVCKGARGRSLAEVARSLGTQLPEDCDIEKFGRTLDRHGARGLDARRQQVLYETLLRLGSPKLREIYRKIAQQNLQTWAEASAVQGPGDVAPRNDSLVQGSLRAALDSALASGQRFPVYCGDWGEVTSAVTRRHGKIFAVLNMANAYVAGGGYVDGMVAQEENMFRRTDCHFSVDESEFDQRQDRYHTEATDAINAKFGEVPLDVDRPRVCMRGPENREEEYLGYKWLAKDEIFPFLELRSAAVDLRTGVRFSGPECKKRICAQLDTLIKRGVRHAVLSAFGCGAFLNPPEVVAQTYCDALKERQEHFDCVAFAIFYPGYGPDNFTVFDGIFKRARM